MGDGKPVAVGKIEQLARWTFWPAVVLTVTGLVMLFIGVSERVLQWFVPVYLVIGMPTIVESFVGDWARLRRLWRYWRGGSDDRA
jgi:hypothetical protein